MSAISFSRSRPAVSTSPPQHAVTHGKTSWIAYALFILLHVGCLAVLLTGTNLIALVLCGACYLLQMIGITVGYHRYLPTVPSRRAGHFSSSLPVLDAARPQSGPGWWARHRLHHRTSDTVDDLHSPVVHGFWWSHNGWILSKDSNGIDYSMIKDQSRYPELHWLDRHVWLPPLVLAGLCLLIGGWSGLVWGFLVSTVLSHHATFTVNSLCHLWGRSASRRAMPVAIMSWWL